MIKIPLKKRLLSSLAATALVTGVVFSGGAKAIHLAGDGVGQVLLAPMYWSGKVEPTSGNPSGNNYRTEFAIVNTREDVAVKVKIVLRSKVNCAECLDFICYLSPADVCRFEVRTLDNGQTGVYSEDDSIKTVVNTGEVPASSMVNSLAGAPAVFASQFENINFSEPFRPLSLAPGDTCDIGHVEVLSAYGARGRVVGYDAGGNTVFVDVRRGMVKHALAQIFDTPRVPFYTQTTPPAFHLPIANGTDGQDGTSDDLTLALGNHHANIIPVGGQQTREEVVRQGNPNTSPLSNFDSLSPTTPAPVIRSTDSEWIRLMGTATIIEQNSSDRFSYRIPALAGAIGDSVTGPPYIIPNGIIAANVPPEQMVATSQAMFDGLVVANPRYDLSVAVVSAIGEAQGIRAATYPGSITTFRADKLIEIERALATTNIQGLYEKSDVFGNETVSYLQITMPTRYRHILNDACNTGFTFNVAANRSFSPPFQPNGMIPISITDYDDHENIDVTTSGINVSPATATPESKMELVETNYFLPDWSSEFEKGWYRVTPSTSRGVSTLPNGSVKGCPYNGMPVLAGTHIFVPTASGASNSMYIPATAAQ